MCAVDQRRCIHKGKWVVVIMEGLEVSEGKRWIIVHDRYIITPSKVGGGLLYRCAGPCCICECECVLRTIDTVWECGLAMDWTW